MKFKKKKRKRRKKEKEKKLELSVMAHTLKRQRHGGLFKLEASVGDTVRLHLRRRSNNEMSTYRYMYR